MKSAATVADPSNVAISLSQPTWRAAAPSPDSISIGLPARALRLSAAATTTACIPAAAASSALISAVVEARSDPATSMVRRPLPRLSASATIPAFWRTAKGCVVDARKSA